MLSESAANSRVYPLYVRGEAYLNTHDGLAAAVEFQNILDHRGLLVCADRVGHFPAVGHAKRPTAPGVLIIMVFFAN